MDNSMPSQVASDNKFVLSERCKDPPPNSELVGAGGEKKIKAAGDQGVGMAGRVKGSYALKMSG